MAIISPSFSSSSALLRPLTTAAAAATSFVRHVSTDTSPITFETSTPLTKHNCEPTSRSVSTTTAELLSFFRDMSLMRRMEIAAHSLYKSKLIRGFGHHYDGYEAVAVGMEVAITKSECIIIAYRDHCTFLGRGGTLLEVFAELMGS